MLSVLSRTANAEDQVRHHYTRSNMPLLSFVFLFIQVPDRLDEMRSPCSDYHGNL